MLVKRINCHVQCENLAKFLDFWLSHGSVVSSNRNDYRVRNDIIVHYCRWDGNLCDVYIENISYKSRGARINENWSTFAQLNCCLLSFVLLLVLIFMCSFYLYQSQMFTVLACSACYCVTQVKCWEVIALLTHRTMWVFRFWRSLSSVLNWNCSQLSTAAVGCYKVCSSLSTLWSRLVRAWKEQNRTEHTV